MSETAEASLADSSAVTGVSVNGTMSDRIKLKPKFAQFICSHREVGRQPRLLLQKAKAFQVANFAIRVTSGVVPRAFWGTESNYGQIKRCRCFPPPLSLSLSLASWRIFSRQQTFLSLSNADAMRLFPFIM